MRLHRVHRLAALLIGALCIGYVLVGAMLVLRESHFVYLPTSGPENPADTEAVHYHRAVLERQDAPPIVYWENTATSSRPTVLYFHGNGGGLHLHAPYLNYLHTLGLHVVAMEYPGYPGMEGRPSQTGIVANAQAIYDMVVAREVTAPKPIIWGFSLGSGIASQLAATRPASVVVLEAPFTAVVDRAGEMFPLYPVPRMMRDQYRSREVIGKIAAPLYIMHGEEDWIVPVAHGKALYALAQEPKAMHTYPGYGHLDLKDANAYEAALDFIDAQTVRP